MQSVTALWIRSPLRLNRKYLSENSIKKNKHGTLIEVAVLFFGGILGLNQAGYSGFQAVIAGGFVCVVNVS